MSQLNPVTASRTLEMLRSAMGPVIGAALDDKNVIEIMVNPDGKLWLDRHSEGRICTGEIITPPDAERIVKLVASHIRQEVTTNRPIVSAELPGGGERFEGLLPPVVSAPCFSIRKGAAKIFTLDDYVEAKTMTQAQADALSYAVNAKLNILIVGGTSSGKTTLANALLAEIADCYDRLLILEDTKELQCGAIHISERTKKSLTISISP